MVDKIELWWHGDGDAIDISKVSGDLGWSENKDRHTMQLSFSLPDTEDRYIPHYAVKAGDKMELIHKSTLTGENTVFCFVVIKAERDYPKRTITAKDFCWYLEKNEIIIQFTNVSVQKAITMVCEKMGIEVGEICDLPYMISGVYIETAESILEDLLTKQQESDGNEYSYEMRADKFYVYKLTDDVESYRYKPAENVAEYDVTDIHTRAKYSHSIEETVNSVTAIVNGSTENSLPAIEYTISDTESIKKYGTLGKKLEVSADKQTEIKVLAKNELEEKNDVKREISTTMQGAINARVNRVMSLKDDYTGLFGLFRITEAVHKYSGGIYNLEVKLKYLKENEAEEFEESYVQRENVELNGQYDTLASDTEDNAKFDKLYAVAKKYLGVPYKWGGYSPSGFDCSGFVCYVLNESGVWNVGRLTAQGLYNATKHVKSPQKGDLCFWRDSSGKIYHVAIYIGNNKNIQSPTTGKTVSVCNNKGVYCYGRY